MPSKGLRKDCTSTSQNHICPGYLISLALGFVDTYTTPLSSSSIMRDSSCVIQPLLEKASHRSTHLSRLARLPGCGEVSQGGGADRSAGFMQQEHKRERQVMLVGRLHHQQRTCKSPWRPRYHRFDNQLSVQKAGNNIERSSHCTVPCTYHAPTMRYLQRGDTSHITTTTLEYHLPIVPSLGFGAATSRLQLKSRSEFEFRAH